tara:strand:+ start:118 stop:537 length:420 start_codon:yes stop_codon:yes gene_type:complete
MFKVYGVTKETAKAAAEKKFKNLPFKKRKEMTPADVEQYLQEMAEEAFNKMKPVVIGKPLATPEFAQELIDLTKKTTKCRSLEIRIHAPQLNNAGGLVISNATKKPKMSWEKYDPSKDYAAIFNRMDAAREEAIRGEAA